MHRRVTMIVTALAVLGLMVAAPLASAKTSKTDKAQNKAIKKNRAGIKKNTKAISASTKSATAAIAALKVIADRGDKNSATLLSAAPAIIDGLTQLKNGLTAAGAGLTSLKTLATSTEYGIGQVSIGGTAAPGAFIETPDIPDTVQQAQVSQTFVAATTGVIRVDVGVRSAESDGTGASNSAAFCRTTVVAGNNTTTSAPTSSPNPVQPAPFYPINTKSPQTSTTETSFPFGPISTDVLTNLTDTTAGTGNAVAPTGTPATIAAAGQTYTVTLNCVDPSASATDPSA